MILAAGRKAALLSRSTPLFPSWPTEGIQNIFDVQTNRVMKNTVLNIVHVFT